MPPRLSLRSLTSAFTLTNRSVPTFLVPFVSQTRSASILSDLRDIPASYNKKIRRGRGPSSNKGQKSGRGHKGQKQKGKAPADFAGGQTPDHIVHGHFGFKNTVHGTEMSGINLDTIQEWINQGRLNPEQPITLRELCASRALHGIKDGVKLLGRGREALTTPIHLVVSRASKSAIAAVEALGGTVTTRFYTPLSIRRIKQQLMHPYVSLKWDQDAIGNAKLMVEGASTEEGRVKTLGFQYRLPDPTGRKELEYYRDKENRGYLAHLVKEGHSPSLFYKSPLQIEEARNAKAELEKEAAEGGTRKLSTQQNRIW
ncbi:ribosomal protein L15 [Cyphellophora europaea CBS 101466]|uniref:Ribosomal protein L15 n=1 Tax=Cyphellophora europaea (strain CBS 101466) TaxID=1220924 RepID=W2SAT2_CYPE1|nr:ribosomal protein L15 [Cyphellophora europaea CBS 101466]ETN45133.1 ribosomal protein L15 [Cyphellophora europaea CBS 101466]